MKIVKAFNSVLEKIVAILIIVMILITFIQVVYRYIFKHAFFWVEELCCWCMAWLAFLGGVLGIIQDKNPRVTFLVDKLPPKGKAITETISSLICAVFVGIMAYTSIPLVRDNMKNLSTGMKLPMSILYASMTVGGFLMVVFFLLRVYENLMGAFGKGEKE